MEGFSPKLPLTVDSTDGYTLTKTYKEVIAQNLKHLILTAPGERIMDPEFGVGLRNYLFRHNITLVHQELLLNINQQVAKYMPFVKVEAVILPPEDSTSMLGDLNQINLRIKYSILPLNLVDVLKITIDETI